MATHNVDTPSAISAALTSSSGGDEVVIAPGTYAGLITKDGLKKASTVTVRASASNATCSAGPKLGGRWPRASSP